MLLGWDMVSCYQRAATRLLEVSKVRGGCNHALEGGQGDGFSSELGLHFGFQFLQRHFEHHVVGDGGAGEGAEVDGVLGNTSQGDQVVDVGLVGVDQGGDVGQTVDVIVQCSQRAR